MKFYTVDVKNIICDVPASNFEDDALNNLTNTIIESGGLIKPLVLKNIDLETYTVVDGHFEYYAVVKAREKNPRQFEMVNAFVISSNDEEKILKQVATFKQLNSSGDPEDNTSIEIRAKSNYSNFTNDDFSVLKQQIDHLRSELAQERQDRQKLYEIMKLLENKIPQQIQPLEIFNNLNLLELNFRLRTAGFTDKKAVQVVESIEKERKKKKFESLKDVVERVTIANGKKRIKGISSDKMVDIVDIWSRILFN
ncbi:chromosome partitioning protein ParB [Tolypothrix sp. FACHB-123]|uniref:chromosome partitioning protein ParB n=1 Tax=Tolypothrix sp. FACHB-123 TaxID=2692868 RepID=UPI0018EF8787|nr:chromosome partitioning protein ParB [Tolypothrix sp. FACHB-123]